MLSVSSVVNSSHSAVGIVLRTTPPGNRELHPWRHPGTSPNEEAISRGADLQISRFLVLLRPK